MEEDGPLLRRFVETNSQTAFAELVRRYVDMVFAVALRVTRNKERAKDVTQTVFADLARKARTLDGRRNLAGWLHRAGTLAALSFNRAEARRADREGYSMLNEDDPSSGLLSSDARALVDESLLRLSDADREAVVLRFFKNLSFREVGEYLGTNENAARMRVSRGLERMKRHLSVRGITSTAAALELALQAEASIAAPSGLAASITAVGVSALGVGATVMATGKAAVVGLSLLALSGLGGFYFEYHARVGDELKIAALNRRVTELQQQTQRSNVQSKVRAISAPMSQASNSGEHGKEAAQESASDTSSVVPTAKALSEIHKKYDPFLRKWGLSQDQIDKFAILMAEKDASKDEVEAAVRADKLTDTPAVDKIAAQATQPYWDQMQELLGPEGWRDFPNYEQSYYYQTAFVSRLQGAISAGGGPLTDDQASKLATLIAANDHPIKKDPAALGSESHIDWTAVTEEAAGVLTPGQLAGLKVYAGNHQDR